MLAHGDSIESGAAGHADADAKDDKDDGHLEEATEEEKLLERVPPQPPLSAPQSTLLSSSRAKQRNFGQQRSILKNSQEHSPFVEENEVLEAKKQLILRRRRLFSHYRQYEQWRRRQFSYDPSYFRPPPVPPGPMECHDFTAYGGSGATIIGHVSPSPSAATAVAGIGAGAGRRRHQYRRQYSCADRSRDGSRESRGSSTLHKYNSMVTSDTMHTDSSLINHTTTNFSNYSEPASHIHMLAEEHSQSISERCTRSRINSAIFVSSEGRGFDSIEFLRRHGSQSVLCRKAKSAENITDNGRKKSFADKRQWRTDERQNSSQDSNDIELKERGGSGAGERLTLPVVTSNDPKHATSALSSLLARSAAVTTAHAIVGSISLEAPPPYMKDDNTHSALIHSSSEIAVLNETSQDSTEMVEEMVNSPLLANATATVSPLSAPNYMAVEAKPRVLVHQRSSTASSSPHSSPINLGLKIIKPKIGAVPMVSVSGPSPPIEKPPLAECL